MVAHPTRRTVGAKKAPQQPAALGTRKCPVFTEGRGTTLKIPIFQRAPHLRIHAASYGMLGYLGQARAPVILALIYGPMWPSFMGHRFALLGSAMNFQFGHN